MMPIVMNQFTAARVPVMLHYVAQNMLSVTPLEFFHILFTPLCLTREYARQGTAGRGF